MLTFKKVRKKPVVVEALEWKCDWMDDTGGCQDTPHTDEYGVNHTITGHSVPTLEGSMRIKNGDYLIRGVAGELYACDAKIFKKTYGPA